MMKNSVMIGMNLKRAVVSVALIGAMIGFTSAAPVQDAKTIFQARYDLFTKAFLTKDTKTLGNLLAPDFYTGPYGKKIDRVMMMASCLKSNGLFETRSRKVLTAVINNNKASVMVRQVSERSTPDKKTGKVHVFRLEIVCSDTWVKNAGNWQIKHMKTVRAKGFQDGKQYKGKILT